MSELAEIYKDKLRQLLEQEGKVDDLVAALEIAVSDLKNFWDTMVLPGELSPQEFGRGTPMEVDKWPTHQEVIEAVSRWKACRHDAQQAWDALSELEQEQSEPLPELPSDRPRPARVVRSPRPSKPRRPPPRRERRRRH